MPLTENDVLVFGKLEYVGLDGDNCLVLYISKENKSFLAKVAKYLKGFEGEEFSISLRCASLNKSMDVDDGIDIDSQDMDVEYEY